MNIPIVPLVVATALFMENTDSTILATALPTIARDLGLDPISLKRPAVKLCGAVKVVITLAPRRVSCSGTQNRSAVLGATFGFCRMMV